ncbi:hypothetical protein AC249_AIPGENE12732 [Exaiptasia diaphana]|nr:hypothetical protein AC249_AIPGENE12732 [Exaiptasia diaphana]
MLGRHVWRCKQRLQVPNGEAKLPQPIIIDSSNNFSNNGIIKCCCGKNCKGIRGLKSHQRSCRVIHGLNDDLRADIEEQLNDDFIDSTNGTDHVSFIDDLTVENSNPDIKKGIKLPKNDDDWLTANAYFKSVLYSNLPISAKDINLNIQQLNDVVYNYFAENYGYVDGPNADKNLIEKYKDHSVKALKKTLRNLKSSGGDLGEIKYVSRTLRDRLSKRDAHKSTGDDDNINHDKFISKNFWGYVKHVFIKKQTVLPSFGMVECVNPLPATFDFTSRTNQLAQAKKTKAQGTRL